MLRQSMSQPASIGLTQAAAECVDEWYYAWYKLGYFTPELRVRNGQNAERGFVPLGDLIAVNGEEMPFRLTPNAADKSPVMQLPMQQSQDMR
ncbi:unnamed protein product [Gongylonema pulchrum]|uniref:LysM domain-containing protein n=1 Tax=Gongylonema pulchrum TaxID=637853 RepID=A0A183EEC5_9BILA|nr:unnamed protein product [Gongylonema pulchrum]